MNQRLQSKRYDFVEEYIELEYSKIICAFSSIDIDINDDIKPIPEALKVLLNTTTQRLALIEFFKTNRTQDVYLTDDIINLTTTHDLLIVIDAIINNIDTILKYNINIHLRINSNKVMSIHSSLDELMSYYCSKPNMIIDWKSIDDGYIIQLEKRINKEDCILRLYPNNRCVIVSTIDNTCKISYLEVPDSIYQHHNYKIEHKVNKIINSPGDVTEDDRYYGFRVVLWYGLMHIDTDAYSKLNIYQKYENQEYSNDEYKFDIIKSVMSISEIKTSWENHINENA